MLQMVSTHLFATALFVIIGMAAHAGDAAATAPEIALDPAVLALQGDVEYGEYLAGDCQTCHAAQELGDDIPRINGMETEAIVVALHAYRRKSRPSPVMQTMAAGLGDEEIAALAAYFNGLD